VETNKIKFWKYSGDGKADKVTNFFAEGLNIPPANQRNEWLGMLISHGLILFSLKDTDGDDVGMLESHHDWLGQKWYGMQVHPIEVRILIIKLWGVPGLFRL